MKAQKLLFSVFYQKFFGMVSICVCFSTPVCVVHPRFATKPKGQENAPASSEEWQPFLSWQKSHVQVAPKCFAVLSVAVVACTLIASLRKAGSHKQKYKS
jgi:hypothetical protein